MTLNVNIGVDTHLIRRCTIRGEKLYAYGFLKKLGLLRHLLVQNFEYCIPILAENQAARCAA